MANFIAGAVVAIGSLGIGFVLGGVFMATRMKVDE